MCKEAEHDRIVRVLFALPEEAQPFFRYISKPDYKYRDRHRDTYPKHSLSEELMFQFGRNLHELAVCSGTGVSNSHNVAKQLLWSEKRAYCLLICGFAGGLVDGLTPGTLVIGDSVTDRSGKVLTADSRLLAIAESVRLPELAAMRGTIFTDIKVLTQSVEKQALAQSRDVIAVDMETFAAAEVAQEMGVPWLAVRVVTDGADDDMPFDFNAMTGADGNVNKGRVIASALTHPQTIPALIRLGARSSLAAKNLARFLEAYLPLLSDVNL